MIFVVDTEDSPIPFMYAPVEIYSNLVVVEPGATTPFDLKLFEFAPIYPEENAQVIHIFPYPKNLPQNYKKKWFLDFDDIEQEKFPHVHNPKNPEEKKKAQKHTQKIKRMQKAGYIDHSSIRAEVTAYDKDGIPLYTKEYKGVDTIILDNSIGEGNITYFSIKNTSEIDGLDLMFFVIEVTQRLPETQTIPVILDGTSDVVMGFGAIYEDKFKELSAYFDNDEQATLEQLKKWQQEYKVMLGQEISVEELCAKEFFRVTDKDGNYTGQIRPRDLCHKDGTWHRSVLIFIVDSEGRFLRQQRSFNKDRYPGTYDLSAGGHLGLEESASVAAAGEIEEEIFNNRYRIDRTMLIQLTKDAEVKHQGTYADLQDNEWTTVFVYLITEEEKGKISYQISEVEPSGCAWVTFEEEKERHEGKPEQYAAVFIRVFGQEWLYSKVTRLTACLSKLKDIKNASDIVIFMDKDNTLTRINEIIEKDTIEAILALLRQKIYVVILTGGILEHSLGNFIEPIERAIEAAGLKDRLPYFIYYFLSGNGKITWELNGDRKIEYCQEMFSGDDIKAITKDMAIAFFETVSVEFGLDIEQDKEGILNAQDTESIRRLFDDFINKNKDALGSITINNGENRMLTLEFKNSREKQAKEALQNIGFVGKMHQRFLMLIKNEQFSVMPITNYGSTFIDSNIRDKARTRREFNDSMNFQNPFEVGIGDSANDYDFLASPVKKGKKIAFLVGKPDKDCPQDVVEWPVQGPEGTKQILAVVRGKLTGHKNACIFVFNHFGELLMQTRTVHKDVQQLKRDVSASGHIMADQTVSEAAADILYKELGISVSVDSLLQLGPENRIHWDEVSEEGKEGVFTTIYVYVTSKDENVVLNSEEIKGVEFVDFEREYKNMIVNRDAYAGIKNILAD